MSTELLYIRPLFNTFRHNFVLFRLHFISLRRIVSLGRIGLRPAQPICAVFRASDMGVATFEAVERRFVWIARDDTDRGLEWPLHALGARSVGQVRASLLLVDAHHASDMAAVHDPALRRREPFFLHDRFVERARMDPGNFRAHGTLSLGRVRGQRHHDLRRRPGAHGYAFFW